MKNFEAVVFDMDGVIFDSERLVIECWKVVAKKYQIENIEVACKKCLGTNYNTTKGIMLDFFGEDFPYDEYKKECSSIYHERAKDGKLPMKKGIKELLKALKENGKRIALASSTRYAVIEQQLKDAGILEYFEVIIAGDMVKNSKPDPEIYQKACEKLGVDCKNAYAIEDSYNGIRSAVAANMHAIMVPDLAPETDEMQEKSEIILSDLNEVITYLF